MVVAVGVPQLLARTPEVVPEAVEHKPNEHFQKPYCLPGQSPSRWQPPEVLVEQVVPALELTERPDLQEQTPHLVHWSWVAAEVAVRVVQRLQADLVEVAADLPVKDLTDLV